MSLPNRLTFKAKNAAALTEFTPTMLISARCKIKKCANKGDFREMANGICDQCWIENEEWRIKNVKPPLVMR